MFFLQISYSHLFLVYKIYLLDFYDFTKKFRLAKSSFKVADDIKDYYFIRPRPTV